MQMCVRTRYKSRDTDTDTYSDRDTSIAALQAYGNREDRWQAAVGTCFTGAEGGGPLGGAVTDPALAEAGKGRRGRRGEEGRGWLCVHRAVREGGRGGGKRKGFSEQVFSAGSVFEFVRRGYLLGVGIC